MAMMDIVAKHCSKTRVIKKGRQLARKAKKQAARVEFDKYFLGIHTKHSARSALSPRGVRITANRLTVRPGIFENAIKSDIVAKGQLLNFRDETKAILNEDLFKLLDLNSSKNLVREQRVHSPVVSQAEWNGSVALQPVAEQSGNYKSLFRCIEERYGREAGGLVGAERLQLVVRERVAGRRARLVLDAWGAAFRGVLERARPEDPERRLAARVRRTQAALNGASALEEVRQRFRGVPVAAPCLRRKFAARYNRRAAAQALGARPLRRDQVDRTVQRAARDMQLPERAPQDEPERCVTPPPSSPGRHGFPDASYRTPENQRFVYREPESAVRLRTALFFRPREYHSQLADAPASPPPAVAVRARRPTPKPVLFELEDGRGGGGAGRALGGDELNRSLMARLGLTRTPSPGQVLQVSAAVVRALPPLPASPPRRHPSPRRPPRRHASPPSPPSRPPPRRRLAYMELSGWQTHSPAFSPNELSLRQAYLSSPAPSGAKHGRLEPVPPLPVPGPAPRSPTIPPMCLRPFFQYN